ncbi:MAG: RagB/SusD family nutrient uptake outer membrane protein, partial [Lutibacter sp.]|nr:RagB/SusD family nutrient uptake outer membrane protein [Lutibacter sp.]
MKNFLKITSLFFTFIFLLSACEDFIEVEPIGPISDDYFNSEEEYEEALIGAYDLLQATFWNVLTGVVASDDFAAGGDIANYDQPTLQNVDQMIHTPSDNNQLRDIWQLMYAGINRANFILEFENKTEFSGRDEIIAQAYFLRAYFTFELVKFYGNIPLKIDESSGTKRILNKRILYGEQFDVDRTQNIAEAYSLIEEDLKEAILNLPVVQDFKYEITKGAAQALLGKVYLYHGKFDQTKFGDAATVLGNVIQSNQYSLVHGEDYLHLFESSGENGSEAVFEIQYTGVEGASWNCITCSEGSYFVKFNGPRSPYDDTTYEAGWGFNIPSQELYDAFDANDLRREVTFLDLRDVPNSYSPSRDNSGFFNKKYLPNKNDARAGSDPLNYANNYRAIRYADVLLMAAEAEAQ